MRSRFKVFGLFILFLTLSSSCVEQPKELIKIDEVAPWCILGFDSEDRSSEERVALIKELGLKRYGFNKGKGHLHEMVDEFQLAKDNEIEITSIFFWLNADRDSLGKLSAYNQELLANLKKTVQKPCLWLSFSNNFFEERSEEESVALAVEMIQYVKTLADEVGCELALYNHRGWFGSPYNQIKVLEGLDDSSISMVFNFHHAHEYVDEFDEVAKMITPYLSYVNLNGVKKEGPEILTIGEGDYELQMINTLKAEGFEGPWGILGHIKTEDVKVVLNRNIEGLKSLNTQYISED